VKIIIEPGQSAKNYWLDLWRYRELLYIFAWRDISVRYKQTALGVAWALVRPLLTMAAFVFFRRMAGLHPGAIPDPILVYAGVLPWQFFSTALAESSSSVIGNANLISKVYFPRLLVPCASVATSFADFLVSLALLFVMMAWYGFAPGWPLVFLPLFVLLILALSLGLGLLLAALNVEYRDIRYIVPFFLQFGVFISPVAFSTHDVPAEWRLVYGLNPMVGAIDGFRWSLLGDAFTPDWSLLFFSGAFTSAAVWAGVVYFRRMENKFADVI